jgi:hypothetical protein
MVVGFTLVLHAYEDELLPCESVAEMIDVLGKFV